MKLLPTALITALSVALSHAAIEIVPGATWTSLNTGTHIQAHGGSITKVGSIYYLIGENKAEGASFQSINCYTSSDLVQWTFLSDVLKLNSSDGDLGHGRIVERPKVIQNSHTGKYVMYMHIDSSEYSEGKIGIATSDHICGDYKYVGSSRPLGFQSKDIGLFKDDDGRAYLLSEDRVNGLRIDKLAPDYLSVEDNVHLLKQHYAAPAMIKKDGTYFLFASQNTGLNSNDNKYATAKSLTGPWSEWRDFAPSGSKTFNSQTTFIFQYSNTFMYMGDRWENGNLMASTYIWLPLKISYDQASLEWYDSWVPINGEDGSWSKAPSDKSYEAESSHNTLLNNARKVDCKHTCSNGKAVGYIGGPSHGILQFNDVKPPGATSSLKIYYTNGDSSPRFAEVIIGGPRNKYSQRVAFLPSGGDDKVAVASIETGFTVGEANDVRIEGVNDAWGPYIDRILVPKS